MNILLITQNKVLYSLLNETLILHDLFFLDITYLGKA